MHLQLNQEKEVEEEKKKARKKEIYFKYKYIGKYRDKHWLIDWFGSNQYLE